MIIQHMSTWIAWLQLVVTSANQPKCLGEVRCCLPHENPQHSLLDPNTLVREIHPQVGLMRHEAAPPP